MKAATEMGFTFVLSSSWRGFAFFFEVDFCKDDSTKVKPRNGSCSSFLQEGNCLGGCDQSTPPCFRDGSVEDDRALTGSSQVGL